MLVALTLMYIQLETSYLRAALFDQMPRGVLLTNYSMHLRDHGELLPY